MIFLKIQNTKKDASRLSVPNNSLVSNNSRSIRSSKVDNSSVVNNSYNYGEARSGDKNNILTASLKASIDKGFEVGEFRFKVKFQEHQNSEKEDATVYFFLFSSN